MCGISGSFGFNDAGDLERIKVMNHAIRHRGPDAGGAKLISSEVGAIGHVRLSIIDVSERSNQPFSNQQQNVFICFNGEIINASELKAEIAYDFATTSDTEVILAGYLQEGDSFFEKMTGMFAILLVDLRINKVKLIRDCFGIKPLWYAVRNGALAISSEERAFAAIGWSEKNRDFGKWYLGFRYCPSIEGRLKKSRKVKPGHIYEWSIGTHYGEPSISHFMNAHSDQQVNEVNEAELLEDLDWRFTKAVDQWSVSDVPVTSFLSSGIDSALVVDSLWRAGHNLSAYTACFNIENYSEQEAVSRFCKRRGIESQIRMIGKKDFMMNYEKYAKNRSGLVGVANEIAIGMLTENVADRFKVVFSGEGADELFGGYGRLFRYPEQFSSSVEDFRVSDEFVLGFVQKYNYVKNSQSWLTFGWEKHESEQDFAQFLSEALQSKFAHGWISEFFQTVHLPGLLERLDAATMSSSVEGRPVFLHQELWHWVNAKVPRSMKLKWHQNCPPNQLVKQAASTYSGVWDTPKFLLRELAKKRLSPDESRIQKIGFPVPVREWMVGSGAKEVDGASDAEFWLVNTLMQNES